MKTVLRALFVTGLLVSMAVAQSPWTLQTSNTTQRIRSLRPVSAQVVWACGNAGTVVRTVDGGTTWQLKTITDATFNLYGIEAIDSSTAWVIGTISSAGNTGDTRLWKTTNGGSTWTQQLLIADSWADGVRFLDANNGVAVGDPAVATKSKMTIYTTSNGGTNWTLVPGAGNPAVDSVADEVGITNGVDVVGSAFYFITYGNTSSIQPRVFKSTDKGLTWTASPRIAIDNSYGFSMKDATTGITCNINSGSIAKTANGWATADSMLVFGGVYGLRAIDWIPGTNSIVIVGGPTSTGFSGLSKDAGKTWLPQTLPTGIARLYTVQFANSSTGWASDNVGKIVKWTGGDLAASSDSVSVTFWANTSTVPDTLKSNSFVQIRGAAPLFGPWGAGSQAILSNVAGDYWKGTYKLRVGDTIQYKFFTNANKPLPVASNDQGWENNSTDPSGNRIMIVGKKDTTLPVQFVNGTSKNQDQYFTPFVNQKDSIEIYFRINMQSNESFSKTTQFMGVRGAFAPPYDGWGKSIVLKQETLHGNGSSQQYDGTNFWSGFTRVPKSQFASAIEYKFVIMDAPSLTAGIVAWEDNIRPATDVTGGGNRQILANTSPSDTSLYWKWWANNPYAGFKGADTVIVTFRANLSQAIAQRGFTFSDTLQVRSGYGSTAKEVRTKAMTRSGITGTIFTATDTVITAVGKALNYQYYLVKSGNDVREIFFDFTDTGTDVSQAERRKLSVTTKSLTVFDTTSSATDMRRMPRFRNSTKMSKAVTVTYTLNLRPAYLQVARGDTLVDIQGTNNVTKSSNIKTLGVGINGPAVGGWASWGPAMIAAPDTVHKMYDDGTHGDAVANDTIYSVQYKYTIADQLGQEFKFGIGGSDNEGGKGGFGNNHIENIDDSQTTYVLASDWGSINPKFYNTWDFINHKAKNPTAVEDNWSVPMMYELSQNYPNPFNPSTTIQFTIPAKDVVTLKIFNVLGQEVMTLLNEKMDAGKHSVRFDASKLVSGVYLYQVTAGKYAETKKMVLLK
ncbi:MAG: T9SS type A sorting domain-containing protein [Ignavibacteriales bacterium]|nr:T9SS type A sorting domain-containing protein [Ignavibacteriales bacterium]